MLIALSSLTVKACLCWFQVHFQIWVVLLAIRPSCCYLFMNCAAVFFSICTSCVLELQPHRHVSAITKCTTSLCWSKEVSGTLLALFFHKYHSSGKFEALSSHTAGFHRPSFPREVTIFLVRCFGKRRGTISTFTSTWTLTFTWILLFTFTYTFASAFVYSKITCTFTFTFTFYLHHTHFTLSVKYTVELIFNFTIAYSFTSTCL